MFHIPISKTNERSPGAMIRWWGVHICEYWYDFSASYAHNSMALSAAGADIPQFQGSEIGAYTMLDKAFSSWLVRVNHTSSILGKL